MGKKDTASAGWEEEYAYQSVKTPNQLMKEEEEKEITRKRFRRQMMKKGISPKQEAVLWNLFEKIVNEKKWGSLKQNVGQKLKKVKQIKKPSKRR